MDSYKIGFVIPIYQTKFIDAFIPRIVSTVGRSDVVVCLVNDGKQNVAEHLSKITWPAHVRVLNLPENLGFAGANNAGWRYLTEQFPTLRYLGTINDDTIPEDGWVNALVNTMEKYPRVALVNPIMDVRDGWFGMRRSCAVWKLMDDGSMMVTARSISADTFTSAVNGFCFLAKEEALRTVGYFDDRYRNGCEDIDIGIRLLEAGWRLVVSPDVTIEHIGASSRYLPGTRTDLSFNHKLFIEKWGKAARFNAVQPKTMACCLAFNQEHIIEAWVRNVATYADEILVMYSERPWSYNPNAAQAIAPDTTGEILKKLQKEFPHLIVHAGEWKTETAQRNDAVRIARQRGVQWFLIVDTDELYEAPKVFEAYRWMALHPAGCWTMPHVQLIKQPNWAIETPEGAPRFQFAIDLTRVKGFSDKRKPRTKEIVDIPESVCCAWHFSYYMSDKKMEEKLLSFGHAQEIQPDWLTKVWPNITLESKNFHPVRPEAWSGIRQVELPQSIAGFFEDQEIGCKE